MNGISIEDTKRFVSFFPYSLPIFMSDYSALLKNKSNKGMFSAALNNLQDEILKSLGAPKSLMGRADAKLCLLRDEEGRVKLCLDPNIFLNDIILDYQMVSTFKNFRDLMGLHSEFYVNDTEEEKKQYRRSIKRQIIDIKDGYNDFLINNKVLRLDKEVMEARQSAQRAVEILSFVQLNVQKIVDAFSIDLFESDLIKNYVDPEKLITYMTYVASSSFISAVKDSNEDKKNLRFGDICKNYILFNQVRSENDSEFKLRFKTNVVGENVDMTSNDLARHIETRVSGTSTSLDNYGCKDGNELLSTVLVDYNEELKRIEKQKRIEAFKKEISLSWEIIPETSNKPGTGSTRGLAIPRTEAEKQRDEERSERVLNEKLTVLLNSPYLARLKGINSFKGYEAYVYPDGKVLLEKFYKETRHGLVPADGEALYIMTIDKFEEFSKYTKAELRDIKKIDPDLDTINHSKNYVKRVQAIIDGIDYDTLTLEYINSLIEGLQDERKIIK